MTPSIRHLQSEWIPEHPALQRFVEFVRERQGGDPTAESILVKTGRPQDGYIDLQYVSPKTGIYLGRLNAHEQLLQIHHGQERKGKGILDMAKGPMDWGRGPAHFPVADTCHTLHFLGGDQESQVQCENVLPVQKTSHWNWWAATAVLAWGGAEALAYMTKRPPWTLRLLQGVGEGMRWTPTTTSIPRHLFREWPAAGLGLLAMQFSDPLSDALGLHPRDERHERWSLAVGAGFLAYGETRGLLNVGAKKISTRPFSLGAGLMSAAFADVTLGQFWEEGSWERRLVRESGFFLPAFWQGIWGERQLALWSRPKFAAAGRWGNRLFLTGFLADLGYLAYNRWTHDRVGVVLQNRLYARASRLQDQQMNPVTALFKGAASLMAPALTERFFPSQSHVQKAAEEMKRQDLRYITSLEDTLRYWAGRHPQDSEKPGDPDAGWTWLHGENQLKDFQKPDGKVLPVEAVAEQLADPKVAARLEGFTEAEVIRYIRRQFRGHRLTEAEAQEMLQRIALFQAREQIAALQPGSDPGLRSLLSHFDAEGRLLPGHGAVLRTHLLAPALRFQA